jgi:hypothetical protein
LRLSYLSLSLFSFALLSCALDTNSVTAPYGDHSIIIGQKWSHVPMFRPAANEAPPYCDGSLAGATAMRSDGIMCVCENGADGFGWAMIGPGTACWSGVK